jgi:6-phosphogluconolactonase
MGPHHHFRISCIAVTALVAAGLSGCGGGSASGRNSGYAVGGTVTGLAGSGLVLQTGDGSEVAIAANGSFVLPSTMPSGSSYALTTKAQPTTPAQNCVIANASGRVTDANISNIVVTCTDKGRFAYVSSHSGIYCFAVDVMTGAMTTIAPSPCDSGVLTGVAVDPSGQFAYSTDSIANQVRAYTIDASTGTLTAIAGSRLNAGSVPCNNEYPINPNNCGAASSPLDITVDPTGHFVYMADYAGSISAYAIDPATGSLTTISGSPFPTAPAIVAGQVPGANSVTVDPTGRFLYVAISQGNDISGYAIDQGSGALTPISGSPFAAGDAPMTIRVDPSGKFAFVTNANSNNISAYSIDATTGALTPIAQSPFSTRGLFPVGLAIDPSGNFIYATNSESSSISGFTINSGTGTLSPIEGSPFPGVSNPASVAVHPSGQYLYVGSDEISGYAIDPTTGSLTPIVGSPFGAVVAGSGAYSFGFAN